MKQLLGPNIMYVLKLKIKTDSISCLPVLVFVFMSNRGRQWWRRCTQKCLQMIYPCVRVVELLTLALFK